MTEPSAWKMAGTGTFSSANTFTGANIFNTTASNYFLVQSTSTNAVAR